MLRGPLLSLPAALLLGCAAPQPAPLVAIEAPPPALTSAPTAPPAPRPARPPVAATPPEIDVFYTSRCAPCHGARGLGDGPAAPALNPKPRDYTDAAWQAATSDARIAAVIVKGGSAHGLSVLMPPSPDLVTDPARVRDLVRKVRSFAPAP